MSSSSGSRRPHQARPAEVPADGDFSTRPWGDRIPLDRTRGAGLQLDLRAMRQVNPTMALRLAAAAAVHGEGRDIEIRRPADGAVCRHMARVGLGGLIGENGLPGGGDVLVPITRLRAEGEVDKVGEGLEAALSRLPPGLAIGKPHLGRAFSELGTNACTHGASEHGAFVLVQRLGPGTVVLAVGDLGVGIPAHLARRIPDANGTRQSTWIMRALRQGMSGEGDERGDGLARIVSAIESTDGPRGELRIWSGAGRVRVRGGGRPRNDWMVASATRGTWAEFVLTS